MKIQPQWVVTPGKQQHFYCRLKWKAHIHALYIHTYVCMYNYVCTYVCMYNYVCIYVHMYVCMYVLVCTYVCMYVFMHTCVSVCTCMYIRMYVCIYAHMCVCMYLYVHTYVCMYVRRWADTFCPHCNIFIYITHIWIKPVLYSRMVSLFHHTSP